MFIIKKIYTIILGSILLAIGVNFFLIPFKLLDGGMVGVGLVIKYLVGIQAGLVIIIVSIPIFILAWVHQREYFYNSLHGLLISSFAIDCFAPLQHSFITNFQLPPVISSVIGGILIGVGTGIMLRYRTSTGGTDLLAQLLSRMTRMNVGVIIFIIDSLIIIVGGIIISTETLLLSSITIICVGIVTSLCTLNVKSFS
ncbi:YitT family protein [Gracilibacillus saliphilus]|uniref:YitT family protein n=1 Tax=Gracilibacillus saliphilus TaxID=543890 RepID=UPI0013D45D0D|nr:YitT family protein [Gracilibacillus saliphilus]